MKKAHGLQADPRKSVTPQMQHRATGSPINDPPQRKAAEGRSTEGGAETGPSTSAVPKTVGPWDCFKSKTTTLAEELSAWGCQITQVYIFSKNLCFWIISGRLPVFGGFPWPSVGSVWGPSPWIIRLRLQSIVSVGNHFTGQHC